VIFTSGRLKDNLVPKREEGLWEGHREKDRAAIGTCEEEQSRENRSGKRGRGSLDGMF